MQTVVLAVVILAVCMALLAVKILLVRGGRFPNTHVGGSRAMARRGIKCLQTQDREAQNKTILKF